MLLATQEVPIKTPVVLTRHREVLRVQAILAAVEVVAAVEEVHMHQLEGSDSRSMKI